MITNPEPDASQLDMLSKLKLPPLQEQRKHQRLTMFFKEVEGLVRFTDPTVYILEIRKKRKVKSKT